MPCKPCFPVPIQLALLGKVTVLTNILVRSPGQFGLLTPLWTLPKPCVCDELKVSSENLSCYQAPLSSLVPTSCVHISPVSPCSDPSCFSFSSSLLLYLLSPPFPFFSFHCGLHDHHQINFNKLLSAKCTVIAYYKFFMEGGHVPCIFHIVEFMLAHLYEIILRPLSLWHLHLNVLQVLKLHTSKIIFILFMKTFSSSIIFLLVIWS